jgi:Cft2 family RNA processing exonuclease
LVRFHFLGGASEVGASCTVLEVAGKRLLIDAGIRMRPREGSSLPELDRLQELGAPDAILVTHAHTDHIGALPIVYLGYPQVPIYTTAPSQALTKVLLHDSLRIMEGRWEQEEEIPLYPPHAVEGMLGRMQAVPVGQAVPVCDNIMATYIPSGHILGACSITLETPEGTVLFAGDYSVDRQQTVEGMTIPKIRPDLVVTESTYGNRLHSNRRQEEQRLVEAVAKVVEGRGKALIPAFALGRAQEAILLLLEAQRRGRIPRFPVYVDGMVKSICQAYTRFPEFLTPALRRAVETSGTPFFFPGGAEVVTRRDRERIVKGQPCAIIASSGMLTGGPSRFYAEQLVDNPRNAIFMTGYQDEESPGHHLLQLAQDIQNKGEGLLRLDGVARRVVCQVKRYGLSAHADAPQMLSVLARLNAPRVILVHGDDEARQGLAQALPPTMKAYLPNNCQTLEFAPFRTVRTGMSRAVYGGLAGPAPALDLEQLRVRLVAQHGSGRRYTVRELAQAWYGNPSPEQAESVAAALRTAREFTTDPHRPFLFQARGGGDSKKGRAAPVPPSQKRDLSELAVAERTASKLFEKFSDFEKCGSRPEQRTLILYFDFPEKAYRCYQETLEALTRETGWAVELSPKGNHQAVQRAAREALPLTWDIAKVSIFQQEPRVRVKVRAGPEPREAVEAAAQERFLEVTGKQLELELLEPPPPPQNLFDEHGRMEQNAAHLRIRTALAERGVALLSFSRKGEPAYLELGLISPLVTQRQAELLADLSRDLGWELRVRESPQQQAIVTRARQLLPPAWWTRAEPAFLATERTVRFTTYASPDPAEVAGLSSQLEEETGFRLALQTLSR